MRELVYQVATSVDGFIAGPGGDVSVFPTEGDHIDALVERWPETLPGPVLSQLGVRVRSPMFKTVLMGWNTYALAYDAGLTDPYPHLETLVFSRRRKGSDPRVGVLDRSPIEVVRELKEGDGAAIWLCGGGQLASELAPEIDRIVIKVNPVTLGTGVRMFAGRAPTTRWMLDHHEVFHSGVAFLHYTPVSDVSGPDNRPHGAKEET
ncbi:MAG: dihydrofolate reductase family protein [Myxococcota bacterium]